MDLGVLFEQDQQGAEKEEKELDCQEETTKAEKRGDGGDGNQEEGGN